MESNMEPKKASGKDMSKVKLGVTALLNLILFLVGTVVAGYFYFSTDEGLAPSGTIILLQVIMNSGIALYILQRVSQNALIRIAWILSFYGLLAAMVFFALLEGYRAYLWVEEKDKDGQLVHWLKFKNKTISFGNCVFLLQLFIQVVGLLALVYVHKLQTTPAGKTAVVENGGTIIAEEKGTTATASVAKEV